MNLPELLLERDATWQPNYVILPEHSPLVGYRLTWRFVENDQWGRPWWGTYDADGTELVRVPSTELMFHYVLRPIGTTTGEDGQG